MFFSKDSTYKQITVKRIQASKNAYTGVTIYTYECEYPRFIHAELLTHKMLSRSSASSRAIPVSSVIELVENNLAHPIHWGKNQPGMQAKEKLEGDDLFYSQRLWSIASKYAVNIAKHLANYKVHKQIVNRILEPFQKIKVVITATEWKNCFVLRNHPDAQPEIAQLFKLIQEDQDSNPVAYIYDEEWHVPYVDRVRDKHTDKLLYFVDGNQVTVEEAKMLSASMCAQVSYRKFNPSLEKAQDIFDKLINSRPVHASPCEHQAMCTVLETFYVKGNTKIIRTGFTHQDILGNFWSGNLKTFIQHRQLIEENYING